jgi:hypothetical protein
MKKIELLKKFTEYSKLQEFMMREEISIVEVYGTKPFEVVDNKGEWTAKYVTNLPKFNTIEGNPFYIESENHDTNQYYYHLSNEWDRCDAELTELLSKQTRLMNEIEAMFGTSIDPQEAMKVVNELRDVDSSIAIEHTHQMERKQYFDYLKLVEDEQYANGELTKEDHELLEL